MLTTCTISRPRLARLELSSSIRLCFHTASASLRQRRYLSPCNAENLPDEQGVRPVVAHPLWRRVGPSGQGFIQMKAYLQFLTTPTSDTDGTAILLHFDQKRYIFGSLTEGTQRATVEQGVKTQKISEIFISGRTEWRNVGGLLGLILTVADVASGAANAAADLVRTKIARLDKEKQAEQIEREKKKLDSLQQRLTIFGPANLNHVLATARRFILRTGLPLAAHEVPRMITTRPADQEGTAVYAYQDENIQVYGLAVSSRSSASLNERKRSHDSMEGVESQTESGSFEAASGVVNQMFNSDWSIDRLHECSINEVKLPAKIFVRDPDTKELKVYDGPLPSEGKPAPEIRVLVRTPWPAAVSVPRLPAPTPSRQSVSYIVRTWPQRGKFDPKKALAFGLKDKSKWSTLTKGGSLTNDEGKEITSEMVMGATRDSTGFFFVDLPSKEYVQPFIAQHAHLPESQIKNLGAYIWSLGPGVADDADLVAFMQETSGVEHLIAGSDVCPDRLSFDSVAGATLRLAAIDPARYKAPMIWSANAVKSASPATVADRGLIFNLEPTRSLDSTEITAPLDRADAVSLVTDDIKAAAQVALKEVETDKEALKEWAQSIPDPEAEIITLGTGSALPSKYRNVSSTLIRIPGWGNLMLDAGEGTVGQLKRVFDEEEYIQTMRDLRAIWISHMHADHHLGTASVCREWYKHRHNAQPGEAVDVLSADSDFASIAGAEGRLSVISGAPMLHWLWEYSQVEDIGFSRINPLSVIPSTLKHNLPTRLHWFNPYLTDADRQTNAPIPASAISFSDISAVFVKHCAGALAGVLTLPSGFKVAYSGDCRPSDDFAVIGKGATVCIHEATFDDELISDARAKRHSTTSEALGVASAMHARAALLTHFSQRYAKVPVLKYEDENGCADGQRLQVARGMKVAVAFDYMRVKVGELAQMEKFIPALVALFDSSEESGDNKQRDNTSARVKAKKNKTG